MGTRLVLDALEMAIDARSKEGITDLNGLTHPNDAESKYTSVALTERLVEAGAHDASVGSVDSVGDAYDNVLTESQKGLYKTGLINAFGPLEGPNDVEAATLDWGRWSTTNGHMDPFVDLAPASRADPLKSISTPMSRSRPPM